MTRHRFRPGISALLGKHRTWLAGRVGLVSHSPAVDCEGRSTVELLASDPHIRLTALWGPEHGFLGTAGPGEQVSRMIHPVWGLPVHSLYGRRRRPTAAMMKAVDTLVVDLRDLGFRPYTYGATLGGVLEAAARYGKRVIVADRPVPLPCVEDGPLPDPGCRSFVAAFDTPMVHGMTPGETARWLARTQGLSLDLKVARMTGYRRTTRRGEDSPPWIPPSPAITSWEAAACYPATVFCEALGAIDNARGTGLSFQVLGAPWIRAAELCEALDALNLRGVRFRPEVYVPVAGPYAGRRLQGARLVVTRPHKFRPVAASLAIIGCLVGLYGRHRVWAPGTTRKDFFDTLYGTAAVREALLDGVPPSRIARSWTPGLSTFRRQKQAVLLYR